MDARLWEYTNAAERAPKIAPSVVAISSDIPILMFVILSFIYADAAPLDVAIVATRLAPAAYSKGTPKSIASTGVITTAPPSPVIEPTIPAAMPVNRSNAEKIGSIKPIPLFRYAIRALKYEHCYL